MLLNAAQVTPTRWAERSIGVGVITFALLIHAVTPTWGLRLQNLLGLFKVVVLLFIIVSGFVALGKYDTGNFNNAFDGTENITASGFVNALYSVIWAFIGYSNVFYVLSEVRHPIATVKKAAPLALGLVTILCMLSVRCWRTCLTPAARFACQHCCLSNILCVNLNTKSRFSSLLLYQEPPS